MRAPCSITATGASGNATNGFYGRGAIVSGVVTLVEGSTLYLVVGQATGTTQYGVGGGGGASYVLLGNLATPLMVAGRVTQAHQTMHTYNHEDGRLAPCTAITITTVLRQQQLLHSRRPQQSTAFNGSFGTGPGQVEEQAAAVEAPQ